MIASGLSAKQPGVLCLPATPLAVFRLLDVPLRVRLRRRALRGTPLPAHITPLLHRQTTGSAKQPGVLCLPATPLAVFRLLNVPLRVRLRRRALEERPCRRISHRCFTDRGSAKQPGVLCLPRRPSLCSVSSTCGYAFVGGPCEERPCRRISRRHFTDRPPGTRSPFPASKPSRRVAGSVCSVAGRLGQREMPCPWVGITASVSIQIDLACR